MEHSSYADKFISGLGLTSQQNLQEFATSSISLSKLGHQKVALAMDFILTIPKCDIYGVQFTNFVLS